MARKPLLEKHAVFVQYKATVSVSTDMSLRTYYKLKDYVTPRDIFLGDSHFASDAVNQGLLEYEGVQLKTTAYANELLEVIDRDYAVLFHDYIGTTELDDEQIALFVNEEVGSVKFIIKGDEAVATFLIIDSEYDPFGEDDRRRLSLRPGSPDYDIQLNAIFGRFYSLGADYVTTRTLYNGDDYDSIRLSAFTNNGTEVAEHMVIRKDT